MYSAKRCPPCKVIWPDLSAFLEKRQDDVLLLRANVKKAPKLVRDFSIESDSKMVIFRNGKMVREKGFRNIEYIDFSDSTIDVS